MTVEEFVEKFRVLSWDIDSKVKVHLPRTLDFDVEKIEIDQDGDLAIWATWGKND